jgi:hypothetical protein
MSRFWLLSITAFSFSCLQLWAQRPDTLTIIGVGDIMMGSNYPENNLPPDSGRALLRQVAPILRNADVTFGNLEGVLLDEGGTPKTCRDPKVCYVFRTPERYVNNLADAGFDILSVANNHAGDFGAVGRQRTQATLNQAGIAYAGQLQQPWVVIEKNGVKYGLAAFSPNSNCISITDRATAQMIVKKLDSLSDIVIVSFHGGAEGPQHQHVPRRDELFHGENRGNVYQFARDVIDAGADVVFGHGPHVTRAIDIYKNRFIAYSLGNFCTYGGINVSGINGWAPIIKVWVNNKGEFLKGRITSTWQMPRSPVMIDEQGRVGQRIQQLTREDFPDGAVVFDEKGWFKSSTIPR